VSATTLNIQHPELRQPKWAAQLPCNTINIGLTGGIGSGKSTVAQLLRERGAFVIDLDRISHALTRADGRAMPQIVASFGPSVATPAGELNRAQMREWVFQDAQAKSKLEAIMHPMIAQEVIEWAHRCAQSGLYRYLVYDIPLLAESAFWSDRLDWIVVIDCSRQTQIERVKMRSPHLDDAVIESIISTQAHPDVRRNIANVLINNDKNQVNLLNLQVQVDILVHHISLLKNIKCIESKT
jgi:dephospho-CoA kinase